MNNTKQKEWKKHETQHHLHHFLITSSLSLIEFKQQHCIIACIRAMPSSSKAVSSRSGNGSGRGRKSSNRNANSASSSSASKNTTTTNTSIVQQLQMLRSCVGTNSMFSETDLQTCLREAGYVVDLAAERLLTGQFQPRSKRPKTNNNIFVQHVSTSTTSRTNTRTNTPTSSLKKPPPSASSSATNKRSSPSSSATSSGRKPKKAPSPPSAVVTPKTPMLRPSISSLTSTSSSSAASSHHNNSTSWLLCQRWVSDGINTQRNASLQYQEQLYIHCGGNVMLKYRNISGISSHGQLPKQLNQFLYPLFAQNLIQIDASCLEEQRRLPIGAQVPLQLRITIPDPKTFFAIFDNQTQATTVSASKLFWKQQQQQKFASSGKSVRGEEILPYAAFQLLQWAQYGEEMPKFETVETTGPKEDDEVDEFLKIDDDEEVEENVEELLLIEEDVDNDKRMEAITVSTKFKDNEAVSSLPEQVEPKGFKATLRPYQRQALYWMIQREKKDEANEWSNQRLQLLRELQSSSNKKNNDPDVVVVSNANKKAIYCDTCGPVQVNLTRIKAPPVSDAVVVVNIDEENDDDDEAQHDHYHPLWERRYLANSNGKKAVSFYVQPLLGLASSSKPLPPQPCRGGILADSMGLGKTVEMLALIQHASKGTTTLIVTPLSLLAQWEEELTSKTNLSYFVYYGDNKKKKNAASAASSIAGSVHVVLTTYGSLQAELISHTRKQRGQSKSKNDNNESSPFLLGQSWTRVVLDEAHNIKNTTTVASKACCLLKAERRWCLSGTILQNSLDDVYGLMKFLKHEPWCESSFWKAAITNVQHQPNKNIDDDGGDNNKENDGSGVALDRVRRVLLPLLLRRTKDSLDKDGKPILTLPPKDIKTIMVDFSLAERQFYDALHRKSLDLFEGFLRAGTASKSWLTIFSLLHRLRQSCDHVALTIKAHQDQNEWDSNIENIVGGGDGATAQGKLEAAEASCSDTIDQRFLKDLMKKFKAMAPSGSQKKSKNDDSTSSEEESYVSNVAKMLNEAVQSKSTALDEECSICLEPISIRESVVTPCFHVFCKDCLVGVLKGRSPSSSSGQSKKSNRLQALQCPNGPCPVCNNEIDSSKILRISESKEGAIRTSYLLSPPSPMKKQAKKECLVEEATEDGAARQALETAVQGAGSAKLAAILEELDNVWKEDPGSKVLIFSQFLGFLDLIGQSCTANRIPTSRLDGKLSLKERMAVLKKFGSTKKAGTSASSAANNGSKNEKEKRTGSVLLISMKAGGVGLNLVAASTVFIVDPWWNAAVEDQCVDRIHRIGQLADKVRIRKFCVRGSVEERILELQKRKKEIASRVLCDKGSSSIGTDDGEGNGGSRPTMDDFKILFAS